MQKSESRYQNSELPGEEPTGRSGTDVATLRGRE